MDVVASSRIARCPILALLKLFEASDRHMQAPRGLATIQLCHCIQYTAFRAAPIFQQRKLLCRFYWISPTAHALYGLTASQHGDVTNEYLTPLQQAPVSVATYVHQYYGFSHSFIGYAALVLCGFIVLFRVTAVLALQYINWQKR